MKIILWYILALVAGLISGSAVNMALVTIGPMVITSPEGADTTTMEGLKKSLSLFEPKHFLFPWLAHALGTLVGAFVAALISVNRKMMVAILVGLLFMVGGVLNLIWLPSPLWFTMVDLLLAYIPMAYLGFWIAKKIIQ